MMAVNGHIHRVKCYCVDMSDSIEAIVRRGLEAVESEDLDGATEALEEGLRVGNENHPELLYLQGMIAWAQGEPARASGYLLQAVDSGATNPQAFLDCAELVLAMGEDVAEAEAALHVMMELDGIGDEYKSEGKLLQAQILLEQEESDPDGALELLEEINVDSVRNRVDFCSTRAAILFELERYDEAYQTLEKFIETAGDESTILYQLGSYRREQGQNEKALECMLRVIELDREQDDDNGFEPLSDEESEALRSYLEEIFSEMPDELMRKVASVPIVVQERPSAAQVTQGIDPRIFVAFEADENASTAEETAVLGKVAIMRNTLLDELEDEAEITEALTLSVVNELQRFFDFAGACRGRHLIGNIKMSQENDTSMDALIYDWNELERRGPLLPKVPRFVDESIRDGLQSPSVKDPTIDEKMQMVRLMDRLGIQVVNLGLPGALGRGRKMMLNNSCA